MNALTIEETCAIEVHHSGGGVHTREGGGAMEGSFPEAVVSTPRDRRIGSHHKRRAGVRRILTSAVTCTLFAGFVVQPAPAAALEGNAVTRWVNESLNAVRRQRVSTPAAGRLYGMATVAMYDAVNGIEIARRHGRETAMVSPTGAPIRGNTTVAAAAAAHAVLSSLTPSQQANLDAALDSEVNEAGGRDAPAVADGLAWGASVGKQVVEIRANDGTQSALLMPAGSGPGVHRADFDVRYRRMAPFGVRDMGRYRSAPPPPLTSPEYAEAFNDVKSLGQKDDDPERNEISNFWLAESGTVTETGTWFQAALAIVQQEGTVESLPDTARLFALLGMAIADSVTACWDTKAEYFTWRPTVAIREADTDGNDSTVADPNWTSRIGSVGASPEYNSGTSAFAGAASAILEHFYNDEHLDFCFITDKASNGPRCYPSAVAGAEEAGRSRIYQGIHFQFSNLDGRRAGRMIGHDIATSRLCRVSHGGGTGC